MRAEDLHLLREGLAVYARDRVRVGTVEAVEKDRILLARDDSPDPHGHYVPLEWIEHVYNDSVQLDRDAHTVRQNWEQAHPLDEMNLSFSL